MGFKSLPSLKHTSNILIQISIVKTLDDRGCRAYTTLANRCLQNMQSHLLFFKLPNFLMNLSFTWMEKSPNRISGFEDWKAGMKHEKYHKVEKMLKLGWLLTLRSVSVTKCVREQYMSTWSIAQTINCVGNYLGRTLYWYTSSMAPSQSARCRRLKCSTLYKSSFTLKYSGWTSEATWVQ